MIRDVDLLHHVFIHIPSPGARVTVAESLNRDVVRVNAWCDLRGMKLNASKTKTMIVSRSRTMHPQSPPLTIDGTVLKESDDLDILGVTFDSKLTFEKHLRSVSRAASQRHGILRNPGESSMIDCSSGDAFGVLSCQFWNTVLAVWCSAADTLLTLLDRVVSGACFLAGGLLNCDLSHRRSVAMLCMLYKIRCNPMHPLQVYSMVWDWRVSRAGPMPFCWPSCSLLFVFNYFPFLFFSFISW